MGEVMTLSLHKKNHILINMALSPFGNVPIQVTKTRKKSEITFSPTNSGKLWLNTLSHAATTYILPIQG